MTDMDMASRIKSIRERITLAAVRAGRDPGAVSLLGVTKRVEPDRVREAYGAGLALFGENYVQEALPKMAALPPDAVWHMIGHLQSNKARRAVESFGVIQSVDRPSLAEAINRAALSLGRRMRILVEVNLGDEESKAGCTVEGAFSLARRMGEWPGLELSGLMALPPYLAEPELVRPYFRQLKEAAAKITAMGLPGVSMGMLSMGMSHDFEVAVEEGATIVRVGTALFGERG